MAKGQGIYQVMARLGIAEAQVTAGQFDQAIASYKEVAALNSDDAPADGVLMQLGARLSPGRQGRRREEDLQARG